MLLANWQATSFTYTKFHSKYFICLQSATHQFPSMSSKLSGMCWSKEEDSQVTPFEIHVKIL